MQYPLEMRFKMLTLAQQIYVKDATGAPILFIKQKMFRLKEKIEVLSDAKDGRKLFEINADRIIDFSANYQFTDADGMPYGAVRRRGMRSLWKAHYEILEDGQLSMQLEEENPWKKVLESLLGEIPIVGFVFLVLLNPSYTIKTADGQLAFRITKKPSIFERYFVIEKFMDVEPDDELRALLALIMMVLLEKARG
jgi:uncharacterized protein YxjI